MIPLIQKLKTIGLGIGIFAGIFATIFFFFHVFGFTTDFVDRLNGFFYDQLFVLERSPSKELVIVDLDTTSRSVSRKCCAELIEGLQRANAKVIGFDILFIDSRDSTGDKHFVTVTDSSNNVIHAFKLVDQENGDQILESDLIPFALKRNGTPYPIPRQDVCIKATGVELPFRNLIEASEEMGHINYQRDNDNNIRRLPLILRFRNYIYFSLSLKMAQLYWEIDDDSLELQFETRLSEENFGNNFIILHKNNSIFRKIPVDRFGQLLIDFADPESFLSYKIKDVIRILRNIETGSDFNPFENKLILVVNSKSLNDESIFSIFRGRKLSNWLIHASTINQIIEENYITESPLYIISFAFIFTFVLLLWLVFVEIRFAILWRYTKLILLGMSLLLIFTSFIILQTGNWPGVILPLIVVCATYLSAKHFMRRYRFPLPPKYLDFEIQIQEKAKSKFLVDVINSPAGEAHEGEFDLNLEDFMDIIYNLQIFNAPRPEVRDLGKKLFNAVFQDQMRRRYDESLGIIGKSKDERLRIKLRIEPPDLMILPWEYLYDPVRNEHLALSKKLSIVRYLLIPKVIEPLEVDPPLRILVIISEPSDCVTLQVEQEKIKIDTELKKLKWNRTVKLDVLRHVTVEKIRDEIHKYHVIHYIGHGGFIERQNEEIGCLVFENEAGLSHFVDAEQLSLLLCQTQIRLIILNACETAKTSTYNAFLGVAPALVNAGAPAVIAMQFPMPDASAVIFSEEFYRSLARHYQVDAAMTDARIALAERIGVDRIDWGIPVLFMRSPDGVLFRHKPL